MVHWTIGPTHKQRLLNNFNKYKDYDRFDNLIMTDSVEYFDSLSKKENVYIVHIDEIRKDFPWSIELEKLPNEKFDESKYAHEFISTNVKIPTLLERFAFNWELAKNYCGFIFMNCDIHPVFDDEWYKKLEKYFCEPIESHPRFKELGDLSNRILMTPGAGYYDIQHHSFLKRLAEDINNKYKITDSPIKDEFFCMDGNFRTFKFPNPESIDKFFYLINNVVYDSLVNSKEEYIYLTTHSMWNGHSEYIMSILFNLLDAKVFPLTPEFGFIKSFTFLINSYPEDRFWNWGQNMESSMIGKEDFINKNYEKLKEYYFNHAQDFPY